MLTCDRCTLPVGHNGPCPETPPRVAHIRRPLRRRGGNQFRLDRSPRESTTYCGAPVTDRDWDLRTARAKKYHAELEAGVCTACRREAGVEKL